LGSLSGMANIPKSAPAKKAAARKTRAKSASAEIRATGVTSAKAPMRRAAKAARPGPAWAPQQRADFVVGVLGNHRTAELLGTADSQPSRWRSGQEVPGPAIAAKLLDLDHVLARLLLVWSGDVAFDWLSGPNPHLEGSRPIDVLAIRGPSEVVAALDADNAGAYA
jgi:Protein of unknown function (DUF2384)